jgi:mycothiol synthase
VDVFGGYSVHPSYNEAAWLWDDLFDWMEAEARRVIAKAPADARIVLVAGAMDDDVCEQRELERHDFEHSRTFHRMSIDFDASLSRPVLPDGITFRTFAPGQDDEAIVSAYREAFADHFGYLDQPFAVDLAEWHRWMEADDFDPSLWLLAEDGGEVAGFLTSYVEAPGDPSRGWVDELGVRPRWRRRGIGRALLIHAFAALAERGVAGAVLTVDTQNKCGAPKLYEHVGMHSIHANHTYIKELRPGRNLVAG